VGLVRKQPDPVKYVVCNADESEPGTIKDRFIMTNLPHLLIEGMIIAGLVTGAKRGILYIRHEYHLQEEILGEEIRRCYGSGLLGKKILAATLTTISKFLSAPAATSVAKKARSSKQSKAIAPSRAISLRFPVKSASGKSPPSSTTSKPLSTCRRFSPAASIGSSHKAPVVPRTKIRRRERHVTRPGISKSHGRAHARRHFQPRGGVRGGRPMKASHRRARPPVFFPLR